jgi:hypothetical protein
MKVRLFSLAMFAITLSPPSIMAGNIVVNPRFDLGLAGWNVNNNSSPAWFPDTFGNSGNNDIESICAGSNCLSPANGAFFYQDLPTVIGAFYNLNFFAFFEAGTPGQIDEIKVTWGPSTALDIVNPAVPDDTYFQYSASNLLATSTTTRLEFFGREDAVGGLQGVTDISVTAPEPSTLLLVSVALAIGAGLRQRHLI